MNRVCLRSIALVLGASAASAGANLNGMSVNGLAFNGISANGSDLNGSNLNGTELNHGSEMPADAESSDDAAPLVVQALTLPDGTLLTVEPSH